MDIGRLHNSQYRSLSMVVDFETSEYKNRMQHDISFYKNIFLRIPLKVSKPLTSNMYEKTQAISVL